MEINLNGQVKIVPENCTIQQLLDMVHSGKQNGVAVAVNALVLAKGQWNEHLLREYDDVLIIKAAQGG